MNKLYAFCALVFLSACGSSGIDGSWSSVEDANIGIEIKGDEARLTAEGFSEILNQVTILGSYAVPLDPKLSITNKNKRRGS